MNGMMRRDELAAIVDRGFLSIPGFAIDGELKDAGRMPSVGVVKELRGAGAK